MSENDPIALCLAGSISPQVALARLALAGLSAEQIAVRSAAAGAAAMARLACEHRDGLDRLARMLADSGVHHPPAAAEPNAALAALRAGFDRAVVRSPEAAVAAYSLGSAAVLAAATAELVDWLAAEGLIGADRDVLDLGCGIGRVAAALAPCCRAVLGLDLSPGMIAEARRRHASPNLRFEVAAGGDLAGFPDAGFDLVLAADTFPYLMQAGAAVAERHVADAARLLRPGGYLAILNLSYGRGLDDDRADAARWAGAHGFVVLRNGTAPFRLWDGAAFVLRRPAPLRPAPLIPASPER